MVHQEVDAMLLECDRVRMLFADTLKDMRVRYIQLIAAMGARFRPYGPGYRQGTFLRQTF